ncbi:hypothetical protein GO988_17750 [Hymenobacter sp. HMF4947]|uniref:DUF4234 domain-containing protein n=1 Tax=Hymenobacter ginkgonis TaxID=2682976 RepID=A0A7K1TIM9_9BACT|nr:hypothetical protein [Hymenobacter ginkgonis]MVN78176.1 hypothetical protein [Hymenobacter ginkgonis]
MEPTATSIYAFSDTKPATEEVQVLLSLTKFTALCLATGGLYGLWWQYKTWRFFKQRQQSDIWPVARAIFSLFTINELFKNIGRFSGSVGLVPAYNAGNLAVGYIILSLLARLPDPYWLISLFAFTCLLTPYQQFAAALRQSSEYPTREQAGFSLRQVGALIFGTLIWVLAFYSLAQPT